MSAGPYFGPAGDWSGPVHAGWCAGPSFGLPVLLLASFTLLSSIYLRFLTVFTGKVSEPLR
jgi:hypothetical protein